MKGGDYILIVRVQAMFRSKGLDSPYTSFFFLTLVLTLATRKFNEIGRDFVYANTGQRRGMTTPSNC